MVVRIGSRIRKAGAILKKSIRTRGKMSLSRYFATFNEGDKVLLRIEPSYHKGAYHLKFHSKVGTIVGKRGACYRIHVHDKNQRKELIVHPVHLRKQ